MSTSPQRWQSSSRPVQCQSVAQEVAVQPVAVEFVDLAHRLADAAAAVTTPYFRCVTCCGCHAALICGNV